MLRVVIVWRHFYRSISLWLQLSLILICVDPCQNWKASAQINRENKNNLTLNVQSRTRCLRQCMLLIVAEEVWCVQSMDHSGYLHHAQTAQRALILAFSITSSYCYRKCYFHILWSWQPNFQNTFSGQTYYISAILSQPPIIHSQRKKISFS